MLCVGVVYYFPIFAISQATNSSKVNTITKGDWLRSLPVCAACCQGIRHRIINIEST